MRRIAILAEGAFGPLSAKTAMGVLRYGSDPVVVVIDSATAGKMADEVIGQPGGVGAGVPVVASVEAALEHEPDTLLIGIAPIGGRLPEAWRPGILRALEAKLDVISGLHHFLGDDPELSAAAKASGARIWDVRRPSVELAQRIRTGAAHRPGSHTVYFCGSDCDVGKMTVAFEVTREAQKRGLSAGFAATGQTGIMISGEGIPVDRFISDFVAGGVEALTLDFTNRYDWAFIEGQGSLTHPAYSAVTLGLLHGCAPDLLILCHQAGRKAIYGYPDTPIPPLPTVRKIYEDAAAWLKPATTVAVALNTYGMSDEEARAAIAATEAETGLPVTDPVRYGAGPLVDALLAHQDIHA
jgi:D-glutamate N-acetyltransferase